MRTHAHQERRRLCRYGGRAGDRIRAQQGAGTSGYRQAQSHPEEYPATLTYWSYGLRQPLYAVQTADNISMTPTTRPMMTPESGLPANQWRTPWAATTKEPYAPIWVTAMISHITAAWVAKGPYSVRKNWG